MLDDRQTILAISTPPGRGGIGVIRLSGPDALLIARGVFEGPLPQRVMPPGQMIYGWVRAEGIRLDDGYLVYFEGPNSFTGEDVVELQVHGSPRGLEQILRACLTHAGEINRPLRLAEPGEFSKRAFLNGKIDLAQAEAIIDMIDAKTGDSARLAAQQMSGEFGKRVREIRADLLFWLAHLEALIDFPEDQVPDMDDAEFDQVMASTQRALSKVLKDSEHAWVYRDGLHVAIVGQPNRGKSSLFNALLQKDRAIVTDISGTTRDVIEDGIDIEGVPVVINDTAGITQTEDVVEQIGVQRSLAAIEAAELLLIVVNATEADGEVAFYDALEPAIRDQIRGKSHLVVHNKIDEAGQGPGQEGQHIRLSVATGEGLDLLRGAIVADYRLRDDRHEALIVTNLRQQRFLLAAEEALRQLMQNRQAGLGWDVVAHELRDAAESLGKITGESVDADLHDQIFSRFCIGK